MYEPILEAVPPEHRSKLEPAQLVIEVLDHQRNREAGADPLSVIDAAQDFVQTELGGMPDMVYHNSVIPISCWVNCP